MKHSLIKQFAILFFALWLPVQSGAAMAACKHLLPHDAGTPAASAHAAPHDLAGGAGHDAACDECDLCYLACAAVLPAGGAAVIPPVVSAPIAAAARHFDLFFPQQPHRPPLASA